MANHELLKLTAHQVKERGYKKAILAIGSCEAHGEHIAEGGIVICEHPFGEDLAEEADGLVKQKEYKYSKVAVTLYRKV